MAKKHEGYTYVGTEFDIGNRSEFNIEFRTEYDSKNLVEVNVQSENTIDGVVFKFGEPHFGGYSPYNI